MSTPLFSVIIPVYNVENYLEQCISSVLAQEYQNYEIILVNDGSTDNSLNICLNYIQKYSHISLINKPNGGLSDARNYGISIAKGGYILFLDSDDYWTGSNILKNIETIINHNKSPDIILHTFSVLENNSEKVSSVIDESHLTGDYTVDFKLLQERLIYRSNCWTKVIKRSLIIPSPFPVGFVHEDSEYSFNLATRIHSYALYNSDFYTYRLRENSLSYYPSERNARDLLAIIERNLYRLNEIKHNFPYLYEGLLHYLKIELSVVTQTINALPIEFRHSILPTHQKCITLLNLYGS